jgi:hypothetical protein
LGKEWSSQESQHHGQLCLPVAHDQGGEEEEQEVRERAARQQAVATTGTDTLSVVSPSRLMITVLVH